ncbi:putative uncharacterized protein SPANXA2-OT1 [Plecturocebus cupreus]
MAPLHSSLGNRARLRLKTTTKKEASAHVQVATGALQDGGSSLSPRLPAAPPGHVAPHPSPAAGTASCCGPEESPSFRVLDSPSPLGAPASGAAHSPRLTDTEVQGGTKAGPRVYHGLRTPSSPCSGFPSSCHSSSPALSAPQRDLRRPLPGLHFPPSQLECSGINTAHCSLDLPSPSWSAVARSQLPATSTSRVQAMLLPQPPERAKVPKVPGNHCETCLRPFTSILGSLNSHLPDSAWNILALGSVLCLGKLCHQIFIEDFLYGRHCDRYCRYNKLHKWPGPQEGQAGHKQNKFVKYNMGQMELLSRLRQENHLNPGAEVAVSQYHPTAVPLGQQSEILSQNK